MSKLTKLINQPAQFFRDSQAYRRLVLTFGDKITLNKTASRVAAGSFGDRASLFSSFVNDMARTVPAVDMSYAGVERIAILNESLHKLSEYVYDVSRRSGFAIIIRNRDGIVDAKRATLFAIDDALASRTSFELTIRDVTRGLRVTIAFQTWTREEDQLVGPENHPIARRMDSSTSELNDFFKPGELHSVNRLVDMPLATDVEFPVDIVYTWVNHLDPGWRKLWTETVGTPPEDQQDDTRGIDRFLNRDELKYSLRSVAEYAPWVRRVFVVTNCAPPDWVNLANPKLEWVDHNAIIPQEVLPVFSSHSIESRLQHVPGLADHFLYFNDDFFLTRPTLASDFFEASGLSKAFMERYGSVNGPPHEDAPDYLNAARNGRRLIEETFGRTVTALHTHAPYALRREVLLEMEERFKGPIGATTAQRFRTIDDISTVSFLYHHYAYLTGKAVYARSEGLLVKPQTTRYERRLQQVLDGVRVPTSICLNDGGGSHLFVHWGRHVVEFLGAYFPQKCAFER
ncbi:MAG: stealth conserved region 3 domain-containing protein [Myxococcales bacterium]|nr:stealth conserved region 3 domain-containing protein [Myxococcales bacterium]MCA9628828.1 stealth conserved region 3 domain-containing protein [Myxococcales bacterium]